MFVFRFLEISRLEYKCEVREDVNFLKLLDGFYRWMDFLEEELLGFIGLVSFLIKFWDWDWWEDGGVRVVKMW